MSGLIWVQIIWHSDSVPEIIFEKVNFESQQTTKKNHEKLPIMQRQVNKMRVQELEMYSLNGYKMERQFYSIDSQMSTLANSEDPDEMLHVAFHQGLCCLLRPQQSIQKWKL